MVRDKARRLKHSLWVLLVLGGALSLSACASPSTPFDTKQEPSELKPLQFQSEDYVVIRLEKGESPETLAERFLKDRRRAWAVEEANRGVPFEKGNFIVIPLKDEPRGGLRADGYQTVPILCYHRLQDSCESALCMTTSLFETQMRYLKENGYRVISLAELADFLAYRRALPSKSVVINLDDGYRSTYEIAYPILKKHGFTAGLFIYTDFIGASANALTWDQLLKMKEDGFEIGSHSISHCDLTKKREGEDEEQYVKRVKRELVLSKRMIDDKLNQNTTYFAFPYGAYNHRILRLCEEAGYTLGLSVKRGGNPFFSDPLVLRRDQILQKDLENFVGALKTFNEEPLR
jgi:peptidoglycan/xylan/chitin deacetylase (PgdA/CDA1 family)